jgi:flagellar secretion chaperone FliS
MTNPTILRARYLADAVTTASPARLVVMLYDRLLLDLNQAEGHLRSGNRSSAADRLIHAQEIVLELRASLETDIWTGATGLARLYGFVTTELIKANIRGDADGVTSCRLLIEPLAEAWRDAAHATVSEYAMARVG